MSTFKERVEAMLPELKAVGITSLRDWCREAEVAESYVNRRMHSKGKRPDFQLISRLAKVANVDPKWLAYGDPETTGEDSAPSIVPDDAPPTNAARPGWDDAAALAQRLDPSIPQAAIERAARRGNLLTSAHPTPELVLQLARLSMRFPDDELLAQIRAEDAALAESIRVAHDAHQEHGTPIPEGTPQNRLTPKGRKAMQEGRLPAFPPTYSGAKVKPSENDTDAKKGT